MALSVKNGRLFGIFAVHSELNGPQALLPERRAGRTRGPGLPQWVNRAH
ncbi:MAG: hypothetical protein P8182_10915 [Deltaproteobacteria bacterium]